MNRWGSQGEVEGGLTWVDVGSDADGRGARGPRADGRRTYHPSYGRHVSVSRLVNVENRLTELSSLSLSLPSSLIHSYTYTHTPSLSIYLSRSLARSIPLPRLSHFCLLSSSSLPCCGTVCRFCPFYRSLCLLSFPRPRRRYFGPRNFLVVLVVC